MDEVIALATVSAFIIRGVSPDSRLPSNTQAHQHHGRFSHITLEWSLLLVTSPIPSNSTPTERPGSIHWDCNMPRIRGKSQRGAAWYAAQSRCKRKENFERALALATRRRRQKPRTPPMAIVEEEIPTGGLESPPEHTLFFVPENWNPRSFFGSAGTSRPAGGNTGVERPYSPCYVEEEPPPEPTREAEGHNAQGGRAATSEERMDSNRPEQQPSTDWDYLNLLFEMRNLLEDQVFRIARLEQRLDMFFAAHSRATPKKQCPTCARAYSFPARWKHSAVDDTHPGSKVL
jgi:hypothetical protein